MKTAGPTPPIILLCLFAGFWPKPAFFPGIMPHRGTCCAWNSFWKNSWARRRGISALGKWRFFGKSRERISSMPATGSISFLKATWTAAWQYNFRSVWEPNKQWGHPCGPGVSGIHECAVAANRAAEQQCSSGEILRGTAEQGKGIRTPQSRRMCPRLGDVILCEKVGRGESPKGRFGAWLGAHENERNKIEVLLRSGSIYDIIEAAKHFQA